MSEPLNDPAPYDAMRDLAVLLSGSYVEWIDEAEDEAAEEHWRQEHFRVMREALAVDAYDYEAIEAHTRKIVQELQAMPRHAPKLDEA